MECIGGDGGEFLSGVSLRFTNLRYALRASLVGVSLRFTNLRYALRASLVGVSLRFASLRFTSLR